MNINKMNASNRAKELMRKFASGASCGMESESSEGKVPWLFYPEIAKKMGKNAITKRVVMKYWLKFHNEILIKRVRAGYVDPQKALGCMVRVGGGEKRPFCFHGGKCICFLTKLQARLLNEQLRRFCDASRT